MCLEGESGAESFLLVTVIWKEKKKEKEEEGREEGEESMTSMLATPSKKITMAAAGEAMLSRRTLSLATRTALRISGSRSGNIARRASAILSWRGVVGGELAYYRPSFLEAGWLDG